MTFENYLTKTIHKAVKEAIRDEIEELKEEITSTIKFQNRKTQNKKANSDSDIIRPNELSEMLSLSISTIYRMQNEGELPPKIKISSKAVGWLRTDIEEWLSENKES